MHQPISPAIRTANSKAIGDAIAPAVGPVDAQTSLVFALAAAGAVDDVFSLGPFTVPIRIEAITYLTELVPNPARNFRLYITTNPGTTAATALDTNILDPQSPSAAFVPGQLGATVRIGRLVNLPRWYLKLTRAKGGSAAFSLTVWVLFSQRR